MEMTKNFLSGWMDELAGTNKAEMHNPQKATKAEFERGGVQPFFFLSTAFPFSEGLDCSKHSCTSKERKKDEGSVYKPAKNKQMLTAVKP